MIGAWSFNIAVFLPSLFRFVAVFLVLYFMAVVIYWFNRTGKVPSLRVVWRTMIQLAKWFPRILFHRIKIVPARIRKKNYNAYPELPHAHSSKANSKKKNSKRKKK